MALEMNDLMMLKGLESKDSLTPYEQYKVGHMQSKRASGTAIAGLTVGVGAAVLAVGAAAWAGSRAQNAKDVAIAKNDGLRDLDNVACAYLPAFNIINSRCYSHALLVYLVACDHYSWV